MKKALARLLLIVLLAALIYSNTVVASKLNIEILVDEVNLEFPEGVQFHLSAQSKVNIESIILSVETSGSKCQESLTHQPLEFTPGKEVDLEWVWDFNLSGILPPGTVISWQWEIVDATGEKMTTEQKSILVEDQRHDWDSLEKEVITLKWYVGETSYAAGMLNVAIDSLKRIEEATDTQYDERIFIYLYPSVKSLQETLLETTEWTGAISYPSYGSILISVPAGYTEYVRRTIPHELSHLVVGKRTFNCKGATIPTWLNEGLATYSEGYVPPDEIKKVMDALKQDTLLPLRELANEFSAYSDEALLAYSQSYLVVDYLLNEYGPEKMSELLGFIQQGGKIDEGLNQVYGFDTDGLDAAWRESLGFNFKRTTPKKTQIPVIPTSIPTLALWTSVVQTTLTPTEIQLPKPTATTPPLATSTSSVILSPGPTLDLIRQEEPETISPLILVAIALVVAMLGGYLALKFIRRKTQ